MNEYTPEEVRERRIGDGERAAITLLIKADVTHPLLGIMIRRLGADPGEMRHLTGWNEVAPDELDAFCQSSRAHIWTAESARRYGYDERRRELIYPAPLVEAEEYREEIELLDEYERDLDKEARHLAGAVISHRMHGEEGLDDTVALGYGLGVTTSLAAALVEYHQNVCSIKANYIARLGELRARQERQHG